MKPISIKIAYIGGGSRAWARELMIDLAQNDRLQGEVALYDIDEAAALKNARIGAALFDRPEAARRFRFRATPDLKDALKGADFVILSIEPGPTQMRYADLEIPARHGITQPVGDTTGPGGIARALRAIPLYTAFAHEIMRHCPRAWVINYTNPMTLCTAALYAAEPAIKAFGCCHEVFHIQDQVADRIAGWFDAPRPPRQEVQFDVAGVNHFTWVTSARWRGRDLMPSLLKVANDPASFRSRSAEARRNALKKRWFRSSGTVGLDLLRRFGALGAAGDRHLVEFVPWYAIDEAELHRWGVIVTPYRWRLERSRLADKPVEFYAGDRLEPSGEDGVKLIEALSGGRPIESNVNLPNRGQVTDLPLGHVVETNARFASDTVTPHTAAPLPIGARALVQRVVSVQAVTLQAALERDVGLAFQAILADPLVTVSTPVAWTMFRSMLDHLRTQLPGWRLPRR